MNNYIASSKLRHTCIILSQVIVLLEYFDLSGKILSHASKFYLAIMLVLWQVLSNTYYSKKIMLV